MISFYCQYNYGGYSIFPIIGRADSQLFAFDATQQHNIPQEAITLFNRSGIKAIYEWVGKSRVLFSYKYIPAAELDSTGRHFECGIQFIGEIEDKPDIDRIVSSILKDTRHFENFFAGLFYIRDGLFFKSDLFFDFITETLALPETSFGALFDTIKKRSAYGGVILLAPKHVEFFEDKAVRRKVLEENKIQIDAIKHAWIKKVDAFAGDSSTSRKIPLNERISNDDNHVIRRFLKKISLPFVAIAGVCLLYKKRQENNK